MAPDDNASVLRFIFQQSLNSGCVPFDWKFALVNPVNKKGPRSDPANYRPLSLTCISYKLLEHVISSSIMKHLDQNNILSPFQHGFRLRHSCETRLLATVHDLAKGIDQHLQSNLVLLDFTKAFDSVPNKHLFLKLQHSGINGVLFAGSRIFLAIVHRPQLSAAPDPLPAMSFPESLKDLSGAFTVSARWYFLQYSSFC